MATVPQSPPTPSLPFLPDDEPRKTFVDDPDADIILRSCDSQEYRVLKLYIIKCSPILGNQIEAISNPPQPAISSDAETSLPVVKLSDVGATLSALLTFIFPLPAVLPSTLEGTMELLSVAQKYEMVSVLAHIRGCVSLQDPPLICPENAFHAYSLAQKYELREEVTQAARITLTSNLTIENLERNLDVMPGTYLHELWKYHQNVRDNLSSNIGEFIGSIARTLPDLKCPYLGLRGIPSWLDSYISSIAADPSSFDIFKFQSTLARHIKNVVINGNSRTKGCASCACISDQTIRTFWATLTNFVNRNIAKAESTLSILGLGWETCTHDRTWPSVPALPLPEYIYTSEPDIIIQSSDLVNFRIHRSILASSSQFFRAMFSLPQPPNETNETVDGLPVLPIYEDAELVRALVTVLYPIPSELPVAYDRVLALLAASQKYDMPAVQFSIRAEVGHRKLAARTGDQAFRAYAIASKNRLSPETSTAARLTLNYPLTFESLGSELQNFEGWALRDLVNFRKLRCDDVISGFESFLDIRIGPSKIWVDCPGETPQFTRSNLEPTLPSWLKRLFTSQIQQLRQNFTNVIIEPSEIRGQYLAALQAHTASNDLQMPGCGFCSQVHIRQGEAYCVELERCLAHAQDKAFEPTEDTRGSPLWM